MPEAAFLDNLLGAGWPLSNLVGLASREPTPAKEEGADADFAGSPVAPVGTHFALQAGALKSLFLAVLCFAILPDARTLETLSWSWAGPIFARDLLVNFAVGMLWDFVLYSEVSPLKSRAVGVKFNPRPPRNEQFFHDTFWSACSTVISSAFEVALLHAWARGLLPITLAPSALPALWWAHAPTLAWVLSMPYVRIVHFFFLHRFMHAGVVIPGFDFDVGAFLYKHVHSLHHLSRNPTTWSGVSMHPIESSGYYSAMLVPALLGAHPLVWLMYKFDLTIAALIGHDGHGSPATGSHDHWLHHNHVTCNYGESYVPLDWFFGSYAGSSADFEAKFGLDAKAKQKSA